MTDSLSPIDLSAREALPVVVARKVLEYALSGEVRPGSKIPSERELAQSLGVGRSVVREALKSLGLLGIIEVRHGDGTYLRSAQSQLLPKVIEWGLLLGEQRIIDLVEARQLLEAVIARLAGERRDEEDLRELRSRLDEMRRAMGDPMRFTEADVAFHLAVARAGKNSVLSGMLSNIQSLLQVWIRRVMEAASEYDTSFSEHVPIFEAIEREDGEGAEAAMRAHVSAAALRLRETLGAKEGSAGLGAEEEKAGEAPERRG